MRVSHIAVLAAMLAIPSAALAQQDGPVGGKVGSDLSTTTTLPSPTLGAGMRPYGGASAYGHPAGYTGAVTPGQVVPDEVQVTPRAGGLGTAFVNGHRVLVDPSNRILRVIN
jgi:acetyl-CoA acetyltransferase